ncbi:CMRF35-like molecule 9 [Stegastes partitus]|uniref:CMRF35-like molecule 9 n=1 Tax=Stegastes partitus TaxID=144197 RepID=A0A9Y4KPH4_9TELE|nr:PREDICTED: CMRF35-like molecule 9 [Stegastes partitus]
MWRVHNLLFFLCIPLSRVTSAAGVLRVFGYEGREANVSCHYRRTHQSNKKYFCKNDCSRERDKITQTKEDKYSIYDDKDKQLFTVTISELTYMDAGKYWCGVSRFGRDIYTEVRLDVVPDSCCDNVTKIQSDGEDSVSFSCTYDSEHETNLKYVCRGKQPSTCLQQALITSDHQQSGRFVLTDDKESRKFTVTISSLTQKDSGLYLCGVHRNTGLDVFSAVELEIKDAATILHIVAYVLPTSLAVLLILTVTLVTVYKCKCYKGSDVSMKAKNITEAGEAKFLDHIYENQGSEVCAMWDSSEQHNSHVYDNEDGSDMYYKFTAPEHIYCNHYEIK